MKPRGDPARLFLDNRINGVTKMKNKLSEEQLDRLMRTLTRDAGVDDARVIEIADSPTIWWGVQRLVNSEKVAEHSPWPPRPKFWRLFLIGMPAAAVLLIISFFAFRPAAPAGDLANNAAATIHSEISDPGNIMIGDSQSVSAISDDDTDKSGTRGGVTAKYASRAKRNLAKQGATRMATVKKRVEIKTDFIALSYARNADSGQIVRVRVPSSMMVTLGLVSNVAKPAALIDAEVIVGDDGLSRAIRFIRY